MVPQDNMETKRSRKFPNKAVSKDYQLARGLRGMGIGFFLSGFLQGLSSLVADFWQMGDCVDTCHWKSGLPWFSHRGNAGWILALIFGVVGVILACVGFILTVLEFYLLRCQFRERLTIAILACGAIALALLLLNWIIYLVLSWPLKGYLVFSFAFMVIATIMLIFALIVYTCGLRFTRRYEAKCSPK